MNKLMILDGDFETQLFRNFFAMPEMEQEFTIHALYCDPDAVVQTHIDFLRAGAQIIKTNTYRVSRNMLLNFMSESDEEYHSMIQTAAKLAKQAVFQYSQKMVKNMNSEHYEAHKPLVVGCCGSYTISTFIIGQYSLKMMNQLGHNFLVAFYELRIRPFLLEGINILAFESIPSLSETCAIIEALQKYPDAKAWITFYCPRNERMLDENDFAVVAAYCYDSLPKQIIAVGAVSPFPDKIADKMRECNDRRIFKVPFILHAPEQYCVSAGISEQPQPEYVRKWWDAGVRFIGGGPKTTADDIRRISKHVHKFRESSSKVFPSVGPCVCQNKAKL